MILKIQKISDLSECLSEDIRIDEKEYFKSYELEYQEKNKRRVPGNTNVFREILIGSKINNRERDNLITLIEGIGYQISRIAYYEDRTIFRVVCIDSNLKTIKLSKGDIHELHKKVYTILNPTFVGKIKSLIS